METLIRSNSIDVIVLDSVAALTTKAELEGQMGFFLPLNSSSPDSPNPFSSILTRFLILLLSPAFLKLKRFI